jgi:DNA-binding NarL/FixJ family response regulator
LLKIHLFKMVMIKVAILEDDAPLRNIVERFLQREPGFECVVATDSAGKFFESLSTAADIDVLLLDIMLHGQNSVPHIANIKKLLPQVKIIICTMHRSHDFVMQAIQEGAHSYYVKGSEPAKLLEIIKLTLQGGAYLDPYVTLEVMEALQAKDTNPIHNTDESSFEQQWQLTLREKQVAAGLLDGKRYKEIAKEQNISVDTIRHHLKNLYKKLDVHSKAQLIKKLQEKA